MNVSDIAILKALQKDSRQTVAQLGEATGLSSSACHRRIQALEKAGLIESYSANLNVKRLGLDIHAVIEITLNDQSSETMERFERSVMQLDDVLECHLMSGEADYLVKVAAINLEDFDAIHRNCLSRLPGVSSMTTKFLIRRIKEWTGYPIKPARSARAG